MVEPGPKPKRAQSSAMPQGRRPIRAWAAALVALSLAATAAGARAEEPVSPVTGPGEDWHFAVTPYAWFTSLSGNARVRGQSATVDSSFGDIWDKLNIGAFIEAEARKGRFGIYSNFQYANLESDSTVAGIGIETTSETLIIGFGGFYRLGPWDLSGAAGPSVTVDPLVGGRFTYLDAEIDLQGFRSFGDSVSWVDPIIGARTIWSLTDRWSLVAAGDIGGFGVGSDFTWSALGVVNYRFNLFGDRDASVLAGYRALSQDYESDGFKWDVVQKGPVLGLTVRF